MREKNSARANERRETRERKQERRGGNAGRVDRCLLRRVVKPSMPLTSDNYTRSIPRDVRERRESFVVARVHQVHVQVS
jgi:hypothetical protein